MKVLAGDIGGTKTLLQIAEVRGTGVEVLHRARFSSQDYSDLVTLLREFLDHVPATVRSGIGGACFGVAGPIHGPEQGPRRANITNLPWRLDELELQSQLQLPRLRLINDFLASANGIEALGADDFSLLNPGTPEPRAPRLVVGAGTGFGVSQLMWCDGRYRPFPSEGGHIHFAPTDSLQMELLAYLKNSHDRVSCERVVSGAGLVNIYTFLCQREKQTDHSDLRNLLENPDPAEAITERARSDDLLARRALSLFISIYGAVVGDLALVTLARGGIYVAGGIAPKILDELRAGDFIGSFSRKGRMSSLVKEMPLFIVLAQDVGLLGATLFAAQP
jgi:glucokinase